jgi:hypothetical protein
MTTTRHPILLPDRLLTAVELEKGKLERRACREWGE